jgi:DNA polymerase-1
MTDKPILLIDSHFLGHQAHYSLGDLSHEDIATGVVFGFLSRILSLGLSFHTNDIVFCWDSPNSYRKRKYSWYKEKRVKDQTDEEREGKRVLYEQMHLLRTEILPGIGFNNNLYQEGCESDDLMAIVTAQKLGDWIIVTADEDLFQCLAVNSRVFLPNKKKMMTVSRLQSEYGVTPAQWAEAKAIAGCTSDEVPGVPGVGMKTAIKYILGDLKASYKAHGAIISNIKIIKRNRTLVTLPLSVTREPTFNPNILDLEAFQDMCEAYGLESFLREEELAKWEALFSGTVAESDASLYNHKGKNRLPRRKRGENKADSRGPGLIHGM